MKFLSKSLVETSKIAKDFLNKISSLKSNQALIVGLFGDLGSGKTTFTQAVGKILGIKEVMTSPTFVIEKRYDLTGKYNFKKLIHIDAYRLESSKEILNLNFEADLKEPTNLILIEWPEKIIEALPKKLTKIMFTFVGESERGIEF